MDEIVVVTALYRTLFLREPDEEWLHINADFLRRTGDVEDLIVRFLRSEEFKGKIRPFQQKYRIESDERFVNERSQWGEVDLLIKQIVSAAVEHHTVVDVGARGRDRSNSYDLMRQLGWRGVLIEANPALIPRLHEEFAGTSVTIIHTAVSDFEGEAAFHLGVNDGVSSLDPDRTRFWGEITGTLTVPVRRLAPVLDELEIPSHFGLLSIDIEGEDIKVLNDLIDHSSYRPQWVIVEISDGVGSLDLKDYEFSATVRSMYAVVGHTVANLILKKTE